MTTTNLTELKNRVQDQHRQLNKLNEELISVLLQYGTRTNNWDELISPGRSVKHMIDYLRMIRTKALTAENLRLVSIATDLSCLQEVSTELSNELSLHRELQQRLRDRTDLAVMRETDKD
ncbi:MAG: hypothetical protein DI535_14005 [Citrobacter freundii]|nr:MAG: hypothetical protein DI535_14005 [Citrobacter freundii]